MASETLAAHINKYSLFKSLHYKIQCVFTQQFLREIQTNQRYLINSEQVLQVPADSMVHLIYTVVTTQYKLY